MNSDAREEDLLWGQLLDLIQAAADLDPAQFILAAEAISQRTVESRNRLVAYIVILTRALVSKRLGTAEPSSDQLRDFANDVRPTFWQLINPGLDKLDEVFLRSFNQHDPSSPRFSAEVMTAQGAAAIGAIGLDNLVSWVDHAHAAVRDWYDNES